jgi:hypothetical protein
MADLYPQGALKRDGFSANRHPALVYCWSMIISDLPSPAEASSQTTIRAKGFAQAGNRYPSRITCGTGFFGIMLHHPMAATRQKRS